MTTSDEFSPAIRRLQQDITSKESEILGLKKTVNTLCGYAKMPTIYSNLDVSSGADISTLRRDQFFGIALATAVKDYLNMRGDPKSGGMGAATVNEIFGALKEGGYGFDAKSEDNAKRGLRISLSKNVTAFRKVPGSGEGAFGLAAWYPASKPPKDEDEKVTTPDPKGDQGSSESSDVSTTFNEDDSSEPPAEGREAVPGGGP